MVARTINTGAMKMMTNTTIDTSNLALAAAPASSGLTQLTDDEIAAVGGGIWPAVVVAAFLAGYVVGKLS
jgi:lactobin A/cerein 7B family class IIb bacteriocin